MNLSESHLPTQFDAWLKRKKIPWAVVIILLSAIIFFLEFPHSLKLGDSGVLKNAGYAAIVVSYGLTCLTASRYFLKKVNLSLQPLTDNFRKNEKKGFGFEWQISLLTCVVLTSLFLITFPDFAQVSREKTFWLFAAGTALANLAFGWIMFSIMSGANQITKLVSVIDLKNIFDRTPFYPVAQWCLAMAASIMGAVTIATLFLREDMLIQINLFTYAIALFVGVFVFFAGMWSTHLLMKRRKQEEIKKLDYQLSKLHNEILKKMDENEAEKAETFLSLSAHLSAQKKLIEDVPVWPYTIGNLGGLLTSVSVPVIINILLRLLN
jgi:hypothetical protein